MIDTSITHRLAYGALMAVKSNPTFPYRTGNLKHNATYALANIDGFQIVFDGTIAPYIPYLEFGVAPQIYYRHSKAGLVMIYTPGSNRHVGFISNRATRDVINYLAKEFHRNVKRVTIIKETKQGEL